MANLRERKHSLDRGERRQNGDQGGDGRRVIDPWAVYNELWAATEALEHLAEIAVAQAKGQEYYTSMFTTSILGAGSLFSAQLHLPEEAAIASAHIENYSTVATLTIYEGPGLSGRVIGYVRPLQTKRMAIANYISSLSIAADQADPAPEALVVVTLTTHKWSPTNGSSA